MGPKTHIITSPVIKVNNKDWQYQLRMMYGLHLLGCVWKLKGKPSPGDVLIIVHPKTGCSLVTRITHCLETSIDDAFKKTKFKFAKGLTPPECAKMFKSNGLDKPGFKLIEFKPLLSDCPLNTDEGFKKGKWVYYTYDHVWSAFKPEIYDKFYTLFMIDPKKALKIYDDLQREDTIEQKKLAKQAK